MVDQRFFRNAGPFTLAELAKVSGADLASKADGHSKVFDVAPLGEADPSSITFLDNRRYIEALKQSAGGACILHRDVAAYAPRHMHLLLSETPYKAYATIAAHFYPGNDTPSSVHPTAEIHPTAKIGTATSIGAGAVIGPDVEIGSQCRIGPGVVIDQGVSIGDTCEIGANSTLAVCRIGHRVRIHTGARIGQRGFGFDTSSWPYVDVPQLGRVLIEDDVEIGANTTVDRGASSDTVIGAGCRLDNLVQIGHNVRLGRGCIVVAQAGIAGSTVLDDFVVVGGQAGVAGHLHVGQGAQIAASSGVMRDLPPGQRVAGHPAIPVREFFRLHSMCQRWLKTKDK